MLHKMKVAFAATAAAGVLSLAGASAANATLTVTNGTSSAGGSITATAPSSRLVVNGVPLNCANAGATGSYTTGTKTGSFPITAASVTPTFSSCLGPADIEFTVNCAAAELNATATTVAGTTAGSVTNISCSITLDDEDACTALVTGSVNGSYTNPAGATAGTLTVFIANQNLAVVSSECPDTIPLGSATFGGTGTGALGQTNLTYTLTGPVGDHPILS